MSQVEPKPKPEATCWDCGAANSPNAQECWLCHRRDWQPNVARQGSPPPSADQSGKTAAVAVSVVSAVVFSIAAVCFVTVILPALMFLATVAALFQACLSGFRPH
jgi:hypothetical protein